MTVPAHANRRRRLPSAEPLEGRVLFAGYAITALGSLSTVPEFTGSLSDSVIDAAGNVYGTTAFGGANKTGSVFKVAAGTRAVTTLVSLPTGSATDDDGVGDGVTGLAIDSAGNLFGVTRYSYNDTGLGSGTVFEVAAGTDVLRTIEAFPVTAVARNPAAIAIDSANTVYVLCESGTNGPAILKYAPGATSGTVVATFNAVPSISVNSLAWANGTLYGTAVEVGPYGKGSVFSVPAGGGTPTEIAAFDQATEGVPEGTPYVDPAGNVYGITQMGGVFGYGSVYKVPAGGAAATVLASFDDMHYPQGRLVSDAYGDLYGAASDVNLDQGSLFKFTVATNTITRLVTFAGGAAGSQPGRGLVADGAGNFYGLTAKGGDTDTGVVFVASPDTGGTPTPTPTPHADPHADPDGHVAPVAGRGHERTADHGGCRRQGQGNGDRDPDQWHRGRRAGCPDG